MTTIDGIAVHGHFIGGAERPSAGGRTFDVRNPANGTLIARVAEGDAADVALAVEAGAAAFADGRWSGLPVRERARLMNRFADAVEAALPELATLESMCVGRPLREMRAQLGRIPEFYRYFAAVARTAEDAVTPFEGPYLNYVRRVPLGVVGQLTPWNHPLLILTKKLAPALAAGNTVVVKPSEYTPLTTLVLAHLARDAGIPDGVVNVVTGFGAEAGAALCSDKRLRKLDLTGGTETGRAVAKLAGANLVRVTCELGGKAPVIVLPDADLDRAAAGAVFAAFIASGQTCVAGARVLVHASQHDALVERMVRRARAIRIGDPLDLATQLGPLVSAPQLARTERYVAIGRTEGATIATGGRRPDNVHADGFFYEPTIFTDVRPEMRIAQDEIFGPVTCVLTYRDLDEAVHIANGIEFGLAASIWTADAARGMKLAERLDCGIIWINDHHRIDPSLPWGGMKSSGIGRETGLEGYREYTTTKSVIVGLDDPVDWYASDGVVRLS
ncbi:MAG TPA: aldehyde dehydrogenase [Candidatus Elarobacter sp.]|jgi:acyl-CoA reductase-like NAD-dependent aldehyde dehydrogenase|nr:aldehyde dehydrogenase [Candidatus Elarobacter sp.]